MFSGLVYCSDCGEKLYYGATNNYRTEGAFFDCSLHWKHKDKCGTHYIREKVLQQLVLQHIQMVTGYIYRHEAHFRQVMEQQLHAESAKQIAAKQTNVVPLMVAGLFYYIFNFAVAQFMEMIENKFSYYKG